MHHETSRARLLSRRLSGQTIIAVHGELDIATTAALRNRVLAILSDTATPVIIDLSGVSFCDASGLALLIGAQRRAMLHGLSITLASPRPHMTKLLRITGLDRAFTIHPTLSGALLGSRSADRSAAA
jgi:anti-sigma B factor antagonist